jgi:hypothetical protein
MLATSGTGFVTVKARQYKNPPPCCRRRGSWSVLRLPFALQAPEFVGHVRVLGVVVAECWARGVELLGWQQW